MADERMNAGNEGIGSICMDWNRNGFVRYLHTMVRHRL